MKILIADDSAVFRALLTKLLINLGFEVVVCEDGLAAYRRLLQEDTPHIAILDWVMPEMDGLQVCREIRKQVDRPYIHVLLLTAKTTREDRLAAFEAGADDFLSKPVDAEELRMRLRVAQRMLAWQDQLLNAQEQLRIQATRDSLTGLWNQRAIFELLDREMSRAGREGKPVGIVMIDLDKFKNVNDTYGHPAGDVVLKEISARMLAWLRPYDQLGRCGGEEFLLVLTGCDEASVLKLCERLRSRLAESPIMYQGQAIPMTLSIGAAMVYPSQPIDSELVVKAADRALYRAKEAGRNRVEFGSI